MSYSTIFDHIFDNCVLSNFALSGSLSIIKKLYANTAYVTDFAVAENMKGILKGYAGLIAVREAIKEGWLKEITLETEDEKSLFESLAVSMGLGEASSIAVAKTRGFVFACDDRVARRDAGFLGVELTGTIGIIMKAVKKKLFSPKEADSILRRMIAHGFYSPINSIKEVL
jgi:predicted nucleic acid-binding protein